MLPDFALKSVKLTVAIRWDYNGCFFSNNMFTVFNYFILAVLFSLIPEGRGEIFLQLYPSCVWVIFQSLPRRYITFWSSLLT